MQDGGILFDRPHFRESTAMAYPGFAAGMVGIRDRRRDRNATVFRCAIAAGLVSLVAVGLAGRPARAAVSVYSNNQARDCYIAAKFGDKQRRGVADCTAALVMGLSKHDVAGMLVNRGVIYLGYTRYGLAVDDFNASIKLDATIGDAYVNRGAAEIALKKYAEGRADIDKGLPLGPDEPQKAYYNRGLADEYLDDEKAAYFDYLKASQLDPDWDAPKKELLRFNVSAK
jgi:tetratricopeptide (TPR) repeat protein